MTIQVQDEKISLFPFTKTLFNYSWSTLRLDLGAGFVMAFLTLPPAMAYALLAGLPVWCGIFASIFSSAIVSCFGSSRHLLTGPSTAIAILIQSGIAEILFTFFRDVSGPEKEILILNILSQLTFLVGFFQLLAAFFKLGHLTQFVSYSVILGYLAGVAIAMIINQLFPFLGMQGGALFSSFLERAFYLVMHLKEIHFPTALVGGFTLILLFLIRRLDRRLPAAVIALFFATLLVFFLHAILPSDSWYRIHLVGDQNAFTELIPKFSLTYFDLEILNHLLPVAFAIALLSIMEAVSVAKSIATSSGQRLSMNQEIFGLGLGNLFSSLVGAMPVSGNSSRTATNYSLGAQTRFACVFGSLVMFGTLFLLDFLVLKIPLAAMAALLLNSAFNIINRRQLLLCLKATSSDALVFWITFVSCLVFSLDIAFYIGVVLSITLYLKKAAVPKFIECGITESGELTNIDFPKVHEKKNIRVIKVEGELFFGAADLFQKSLKAIMEGDRSARVILLQLKNARDIDATTCLALQQLYEYLKSSGRHLVACGLTWHIWDVLSNSGFVALVGKENLFIFDERKPNQHMQKAMQRAKYLVKEETASSQAYELALK